MSRLRIPERYGQRFGLDTRRTYTYEEAKEAFMEAMPEGMELTDTRLASFLGLEAEANPMPADLSFYKDISGEYKEFLEEQGVSADRIAPEDDKDGSFELLAYYHLGIPSFALDFWTPPVEKTEPQSGDKNEKPGKAEKSSAGEKENPDIADCIV